MNHWQQRTSDKDDAGKKGVGNNRSSGEETESAKLMAMKDNWWVK